MNCVSVIKTIVLFLTIVTSYPIKLYSQTQPGYLMSIANVQRMNNNIYEFDVYMRSTGSIFHLTSYQCVFSFNQSIINNGSLTFSYIQGTSELQYIPPATAVGLINTYGAYVLTFASLPESELITSVSKRVGRFRLTNSVSFLNTSINLRWRFIGLVKTILTGSSFTNITNTFNHNNLSEPTSFPLSVSINDGWNLVSIPGLHPVNQDINSWWVNRDPGSGVYKLENGFQSVTSVEPGIGYWMRNLGNTIYNTGDEWPSTGIHYISNHPIEGTEGWNLIGTYDYTVSVSDITTSPEGLFTGLVYEYKPAIGYRVVNSLIPGYGYFVRLSGEGLINLPDPAFNKQSKYDFRMNNNWGRIIFTDNSGKTSTLYLTSEPADLNKYQMPPVVFDNIFDVRFSSGRFVENIKSGFQHIELRGIEFPLSVKLENTSISIKDETTGFNKTFLKSGDDYVIYDKVDRIIISNNEIPSDFRLDQNYPNPFNPVTKISFMIPQDTHVKIKVFDLLGQEIKVLINEFINSGYHFVEWDGRSESGAAVTSGFYIYRMEAGDFVQSKKMLMIK